MPNPKKFPDKPECDDNVYRDTAHASARVPTNWVWVFIGPGNAPPAPNPPIQPPLAGAALAALQTQAQTDATNEANSQMNAIAAYSCPGRCDNKGPVHKALIGPATSIGAPQLVNGGYNGRFNVMGVPFVIDIKIQEWVQAAEQDYEVTFVCRR